MAEKKTNISESPNTNANTNNNTNNVNVHLNVKHPRKRKQVQKKAEKPNWLIKAIVIAIIGITAYFVKVTYFSGSHEPKELNNTSVPIEGHREI